MSSLTQATSRQLSENCKLYDAAEGAAAAGRWTWSKNCSDLLEDTNVTREKLAEINQCDKSYIGRVVHAYRHARKEWGGPPNTPDKVREYQLICNKGPTVAEKIIDGNAQNAAKNPNPTSTGKRTIVPWQEKLSQAFRAAKSQRASEQKLVDEINDLGKKNGFDLNACPF